MTVLVQRCEHLKAATMELVALVLEEKKEGTVLHCKTKLTFPESAGLHIGWIRDKKTVRAPSGDVRDAETELDLLGALEYAKLERFGLCQQGREDSWGRRSWHRHGQDRGNRNHN